MNSNNTVKNYAKVHERIMQEHLRITTSTIMEHETISRMKKF